MSNPINGSYFFSFLHQTLILLPQKAIFWKETGILLIADIHLGKVNHFRKAGIAVPQIASASDYTILEALLDQYPVQEVFFLGDLFHSEFNQACTVFLQWISSYPDIDFVLIKGNHDVLPQFFYEAANIKVYTDTLIKPPFIFSHIPVSEKTMFYNLSGHLHPAVKLFGKGKQVLTLPCYCFGQTTGVLPAFGSFTGSATINPGPEDQVFVVAANMVSSLKK